MSEDKATTLTGADYTADDYDGDAHVPADAALRRLVEGNHIFMTGLGELFVIRVAGNVVGPIELASAVYACEHLHTRLLLVLGHTHCGAIKAALDGEEGSVAAITERIAAALGDVRDPYEASVANARAAAAELSASPELARLAAEHDLDIRVAIYHTHCGVVDFL